MSRIADGFYSNGPIIFLVLLFAGAIITIFILFLINLQNLMREVDPSNQEVEPGNVWLMLIPIFNYFYPFILYPKICDSVRKEFEDRGIDNGGDYSRGIGLALPILGFSGYIPIIGTLASLAHLVVFVIFWVKTAEYKQELRKNPRVIGGFSTNRDILD